MTELLTALLIVAFVFLVVAGVTVALLAARDEQRRRRVRAEMYRREVERHTSHYHRTGRR